jgi:hypothetical protein
MPFSVGDKLGHYERRARADNALFAGFESGTTLDNLDLDAGRSRDICEVDRGTVGERQGARFGEHGHTLGAQVVNRLRQRSRATWWYDTYPGRVTLGEQLTKQLCAPAVQLQHSALVRVTHWITAFCFLALLVRGVEIVISHPRFYWGETGSILTPVLFKLPIPSSRALVPTGYGYVLPDQNGWSRYLHFQAA